jgi:hypothetical protein
VSSTYSRLIALLALAIASGALVTASAAPVAVRQPYDLALSADRKLQHFDRTHPDCDLWTDWRNLCSRMGPSGATTCRTDPFHLAKPSEPFCAEGELPSSDTLLEGRSRSRYCVRFMDQLSPQQTEPKGAHYCALYRSDRPFNGERLAQMETPDCVQWSWNEGDCVTDRNGGNGEAPSCASSEVRKLRRQFPFVCTKWSSRARCPHPVGGAEREDDGSTSLLMEQLQVGRPVWGLYCKRS